MYDPDHGKHESRLRRTQKEVVKVNRSRRSATLPLEHAKPVQTPHAEGGVGTAYTYISLYFTVSKIRSDLILETGTVGRAEISPIRINQRLSFPEQEIIPHHNLTISPYCRE